jgi:hypothetical protein
MGRGVFAQPGGERQVAADHVLKERRHVNCRTNDLRCSNYQPQET